MAIAAIEKGIPVPTDARRAKWPWKDMDVGDSFLMPDAKQKNVQPMTSIAGSRLNRRFIARQVDGGVRVWRVA
jgi:hypothetical protein